MRLNVTRVLSFPLFFYGVGVVMVLLAIAWYDIPFLEMNFYSVLQNYSMAVYLVKQLSSTVLLQRLRAKGIRNPDHSRALSTSDVLLFKKVAFVNGDLK